MPSGRRSSKRPYAAQHVELDVLRASGGRSTEDDEQGAWVVQQVRGSDREFRCPGCDQLVSPGTPHVVAWRSDGLPGQGLDDRRHWHRSCWSARSRRGPSGRAGR
ncbi:hypothetical protein [Cellulomonas sp. HZM]|uniref:hypothetical protein n=1 Tax=Cellulomonas sp. HZM TaxID=1454010 RepID=UPI0004932841|nr:hypothetical protein [Cellulomonas sp. HZM]